MAHTSHQLTHFMATGAEHCLDDYHFIRSTHDTVHDQEAQLNRILRMMNEDDIRLNWYIDTTPIGRSRSLARSYKFERAALPGNIAYLRLREREQEELKRRPSSNFAPVRTYERRRRISEQGNSFSLSNSFARQRAWADSVTNASSERSQRERPTFDDEMYRKDKYRVAEKSANDRDRYRQTEQYQNETSSRAVDIRQGQRSTEASTANEQRSRAQKSTEELAAERKKHGMMESTEDDSKQSERKSTGKVEEDRRQKPIDENPKSQSQEATDADKRSQEKSSAKNDESQTAKAATVEQSPEVQQEGTNAAKRSNDKSSVADAKSSTEKPSIDDPSLDIQQKKKAAAKSSAKDATEKPSVDDQTPEMQRKKSDAGKSSVKEATEKPVVDDQAAEVQRKKSDATKTAAKEAKSSMEKPIVDDQSLEMQQQQNSDSAKSSAKDAKNTTEKPTADDQPVEKQRKKSDATNKPVADNHSLEKQQQDDDAAKRSKEKDSEEELRKAKTSNVQTPELKQENADDLKWKENTWTTLRVRYNEDSSTNQSINDSDPLGYIVCEWSSPSSSPSALQHYTLERRCGDQPWSPIGEKIATAQNRVELSLSSMLADQDTASGPTSFRLKAHSKDGKTWTSKPTEEVDLESIASARFITPDVEILSGDSVQLSWKDDGSKKAAVYDIEKRETPHGPWTKVSKVALSQGSAQVYHLADAEQCQFRLAPSKPDADNESDLLTVQNVNEWLSSLRLEPTSGNIVDIDISEEGFKQFDQYRVEYAAIDQLDQWKQVSNITRDAPHLTVDKLNPGVDYKFRLTPIQRGATAANDGTSSNLSLVLDVKMPTTRKGRLVKNEAKKAAPPTQFAVHKTDATTVFIEAILPTDKPAMFEDVFEVYSKNEVADDDWVKVGTIDKDHLSMTIKNLPENTAYTFKIHNETTPSTDEQNNIVQEFNFETASVKLYDPSIFLEKVQENLENVVDSVMKAAAGHQTLEESVNVSLNDVIRKIFLEEDLVPNEQYGFDTLALSDDLQLFRGPKQMLLQDLEANEANDAGKNEGEIIIHNHRQYDREQQPVIVREENGNTRIGNIDGDVIIRNVITDVLLSNEEKRNQLSMNIVGQAFLKRVQGTLIASRFKGIIVVKNVDKP